MRHITTALAAVAAAAMMLGMVGCGAAQEQRDAAPNKGIVWATDGSGGQAYQLISKDMMDKKQAVDAGQADEETTIEPAVLKDGVMVAAAAAGEARVTYTDGHAEADVPKACMLDGQEPADGSLLVIAISEDGAVVNQLALRCGGVVDKGDSWEIQGETPDDSEVYEVAPTIDAGKTDLDDLLTNDDWDPEVYEEALAKSEG